MSYYPTYIINKLKALIVNLQFKKFDKIQKVNFFRIQQDYF